MTGGLSGRGACQGLPWDVFAYFIFTSVFFTVPDIIAVEDPSLRQVIIIKNSSALLIGDGAVGRGRRGQQGRRADAGAARRSGRRRAHGSANTRRYIGHARVYRGDRDGLRRSPARSISGRLFRGLADGERRGG